jgi:hypothetical protein
MPHPSALRDGEWSALLEMGGPDRDGEDLDARDQRV